MEPLPPDGTEHVPPVLTRISSPVLPISEHSRPPPKIQSVGPTNSASSMRTSPLLPAFRSTYEAPYVQDSSAGS
ncbi:hypothetical protein M426DRAFT_8739 [Hypoxylon sp. CI-4A]|nr:hypothetical protein M426DRAFT_8739 [Hypoxylon sp. CI-4A]